MSKKDERVEVRMSKEELEGLDELAKRRSMSRSAYIHMLIQGASNLANYNKCDDYMMKQFKNISIQMARLQSESKVLEDEGVHTEICSSINCVCKEVRDLWLYSNK